jgi:hypothetical protein
MMFTLPAAAGAAADPSSVATNLASAGTVTAVSSEFSPQWAAANAIDDDLATEWSSAGDGNNSFITIDLGESQAIGGFEFLTRTMADGSATTTTYEVIVDDSTVFGPFPAGNPAESMRSSVDTEGQIVRFEVTDSTGGNTGAIEIRILAPSG